MENNMKQTAVEWLFKELLNSEPNILEWNKLLQQAKAMYKEEMIKSYATAVMKENNSDYIGMNEETSGEIYYNEIYGGNK